MTSEAYGPPLNVTVNILPMRKYFINGYSWNVFDEDDKVAWDGWKGVHGWTFSLKLSWKIARFIIKRRYHV
jgi:hypothetical protein